MCRHPCPSAPPFPRPHDCNMVNPNRSAPYLGFLPLSALLTLLFSVLIYLTFYYEPNYVFSPEAMSAIGKRAIRDGESSSGLNATVASVVRQLSERYPGRILPNPQWMFNNAGGAMGAMLVLHCSVIEYVIVFGTAVGTEGHT